MKIGSVLALTAALLLAGCGVADNMSHKMDDSLDQIKKTNEAVKEQCEAVTFESLLKPEFAQDLSPVPFDLMPFAKKFGDCSSPDDITEVMYLWMKKLNEVTLDVPTPTDAQTDAFNHHKLHILSAMQAVAGLLTQDKVDNIIATQIEGEGRYQDTALQILMLRVDFLNKAMLQASLLSSPLNNLGKVQKAIEYANAIDKIARLPYARPIGPKGEPRPTSIKYTINAFVGPYAALNKEVDFDRDLAVTLWKQIRSLTNSCIGAPQMPDACTASGVHEKLTPSMKAQVSQSQAYVNQKILGWGGTLD